MNNWLHTKQLNGHVFLIIHLTAITFWGFQLLYSDAYYVNYAVLLMISAVCVYKNMEMDDMPIGSKLEKYADVLIKLFAILYAGMVVLANYKSCTYGKIPEEYGSGFRKCYHYFMIIMLFTGGYFAFLNIFNVLVRNLNKLNWNRSGKTVSPETAFSVCFMLLVSTRLIVLFCSQYPGVLSPDSISQMTQLLSGSYSNHHPFYHTMVIKIFVMLGLHLFHDINAAVATYSVFQIVFTSLCFAFATGTVARIKAPRWIVITSILFFVLMPYHIIYAVTMWKDVMFGCFVLLLVTSVFRCMNNIGHEAFNYTMLAVASLGTCLFRSNGFFVFVLLTIAFAVIWKMKNKKVLMVFASAIVICFIMKYPVLERLEVTPPDTIESLSIPAQQIARVIQEEHELNDWQSELLSDVIDIDQIPETYKDWISDPIKALVRQKGNQNLLVEKKQDYMKLYISLGVKYPMAYLRAWIDQTRGYWNAGYEYLRWNSGIIENDLGIERTTNSVSFELKFHEYLWLFTNIQGLRLFLSIGLFVWIDLLMLMIALLRKDKVGAFITLPILVVVASLLVATPIFSEFRYIYAAFCTLPIVVVIALRPLDTGTKVVNDLDGGLQYV